MFSDVRAGRATIYGYVGHAEMIPCFYSIAGIRPPQPYCGHKMVIRIQTTPVRPARLATIATSSIGSTGLGTCA